jgi:hypothetical protein
MAMRVRYSGKTALVNGITQREQWRGSEKVVRKKVEGILSIDIFVVTLHRL